MQIGRELPNQKIPAGTSWKSRFLFAVACRQDTDEATFDRIRSAYSLAGKPGLAVEMHKGRLLSQIFDVLLEAENSAAVAEFGKASLPSCLLVRTRQLNPNWDAVVVDMETALWKRMGIYETTGLTTLRCDQPQKLFLGHPYAGSHPAVRIALKQWEPDFVELEVHNPTSEPVSFAVSSQDALAALFPKMDETVVTLAPGETRLVSQRRHSLEAKR